MSDQMKLEHAHNTLVFRPADCVGCKDVMRSNDLTVTLKGQDYHLSCFYSIARESQLHTAIGTIDMATCEECGVNFRDSSEVYVWGRYDYDTLFTACTNCIADPIKTRDVEWCVKLTQL